jgi:hypothetical protein
MSVLARVRARVFAAADPVDPWALVHVVFTLTDRDLARLNVAVGPCVPPPTRKRPWVGITNQEPGDFRALETLFSIVVTASPAEPWQATRVDGPGRLDTFSDAFVAALADINRVTLARGTAAPAINESTYDTVFRPELEIAERWLPHVDWRQRVSLRYAQQRVTYLGAFAREMQDRGRPLYCWSGPGFDPWTGRLVAKYLGASSLDT